MHGLRKVGVAGYYAARLYLKPVFESRPIGT